MHGEVAVCIHGQTTVEHEGGSNFKMVCMLRETLFLHGEITLERAKEGNRCPRVGNWERKLCFKTARGKKSRPESADTTRTKYKHYEEL